MEWWMWPAWGILLFIQNAAHGAMSRIRNSGSLKGHIIVALFSNGVWFASFAFMFNSIFQALIVDERVWFVVVLGTFYTVCTMSGSLTSHWYLMRLEGKLGGKLARRR